MTPDRFEDFADVVNRTRRGASAMAHNRFVLPTTILVTILIAWAVIYRYAKPPTRQPQPANAEIRQLIGA